MMGFDFDAALKYAQEAHEIVEKYPNDNQLAMTLMNLGNINSRLGNHEKSIEWQQELLNVSRKLDNSAFISIHEFIL